MSLPYRLYENFKSIFDTLINLGASRDFAFAYPLSISRKDRDKFSLSQINPRQGERPFNKTRKQLKNLDAQSLALLFFHSLDRETL